MLTLNLMDFLNQSTVAVHFQKKTLGGLGEASAASSFESFCSSLRANHATTKRRLISPSPPLLMKVPVIVASLRMQVLSTFDPDLREQWCQKKKKGTTISFSFSNQASTTASSGGV